MLGKRDFQVREIFFGYGRVLGNVFLSVFLSVIFISGLQGTQYPNERSFNAPLKTISIGP